MKEDALLAMLVRYERQLHHPEIRCQPEVVEKFLHHDFFEIGRSGRRYSREKVIAALANEAAEPIASDDFALSMNNSGYALLTYRSFILDEQGQVTKQTLRTSLWEECITTPGRWQMRFHQGTPMAE
ncbi:nuclear transport factor 2 family protein [Kosakonia quasisacchari]|uniref:Nuclear transport factor 2 family protein n=1 Tax=Kosakonia quasisacchari TaxID=2529380 RepID=A0A4R0H1L0_9ENTR|nr:DUF4440 domain-containing protein [Kosakonia quasisacchari]TCC03438.1 nuclear transport factor 2 family protein [Kosakonia quasisacchari]